MRELALKARNVKNTLAERPVRVENERRRRKLNPGERPALHWTITPVFNIFPNSEGGRGRS